MKKRRGGERRREAQVWLRVRLFFFFFCYKRTQQQQLFKLGWWKTLGRRTGTGEKNKHQMRLREHSLPGLVPVCLCTGCFLNAHHYSVYIAEFRVLLERACHVVCVVYRHALLNEVISRGTGDASRAVGMTRIDSERISVPSTCFCTRVLVCALGRRTVRLFYTATESRVEKKAAMGKRDAERQRKRKEVSLRH